MKRKATFIGSNEWRKRDVEVKYHEIAGIGRITDKPTGIWLQATDAYAAQHDVFAELAHRVKQLS